MKRIFTSLIGFSLLSCTAFAQNTPTSCLNPEGGVPARLDLGAAEALTITSSTGEHNFSVEIADTQEEQRRGLMYRDNLAEDAGMLFEYPQPATLSIWMKNTWIPLDILFIRGNGKILKIEHGATPCSLRSVSSEGTVRAVLELPGGRAKALGIQPGDEVSHEFFGNASAVDEK